MSEYVDYKFIATKTESGVHVQLVDTNSEGGSKKRSRKQRKSFSKKTKRKRNKYI